MKSEALNGMNQIARENWLEIVWNEMSKLNTSSKEGKNYTYRSIYIHKGKQIQV